VRSILSVTLAAAALGAAAAFAQSAAADGRTPTLSALSRYISFPDKTFARARSAADTPDAWQFSPVASDGETVSIHLSKKLYLETDSAVAQRWADFFASLIHGPELATLDAYFLTLKEVQGVCGIGALACYGGNQMFAPAQDPAFDLSAEAVVTHEYGHHVAAHRLNDPWDAVDTGAKRWATYENVCVKTRRHVYWPGAEDQNHYFYNPGEGWAESYRVLNERRAGLAEPSWDIVTNELYPDDTALSLLQQDVTSPWTKNTVLTKTGSVSRTVRSRAYVVSTPLDGTMRVSLRSAANAKFRLDILSPNAKSLSHATGKNTSASATICSERAVRIRVNRVSGKGSFRLRVSHP
jgi:hypothetical protein